MINPQYLASPGLDPQAKDAFWNVVQDCLVEIHGLSLFEAIQKSRDLRTQIETTATRMSSEMIYHAEPFEVACDLAGKHLNLTSLHAQYEVILSRHHW